MFHVLGSDITSGGDSKLQGAVSKCCFCLHVVVETCKPLQSAMELGLSLVQILHLVSTFEVLKCLGFTASCSLSHTHDELQADSHTDEGLAAVTRTSCMELPMVGDIGSLQRWRWYCPFEVPPPLATTNPRALKVVSKYWAHVESAHVGWCQFMIVDEKSSSRSAVACRCDDKQFYLWAQLRYNEVLLRRS